MIAYRFQSDLAAPSEAVWGAVSRMSGVNDELWPYLRMTHAGHGDQLLPSSEDGLVSFSSWILLFGLVPIDRHFLCAEPAGYGFAEESHSWLQRIWRHRRRLDDIQGGTRLADEVEFEPRIAILAPIAALIVRAVFRHRHKRLIDRYGALAHAGP